MNYSETHDDDYVEIPSEDKDYIPFHFSSCQEYVDYLDEADLECLIDEWLEPIGLGWIIGKSGSGKTLLAFDMGMHIASGLPWYGREVKQGHVYYFALEGGKKGLSKRITAIQEAKPELAEKGFGYFHLSRQEFNLYNEHDANRLIKTMKDTKNKPAIIFYDTLSEANQGAKENSIDDMKAIFSRLREISNKLNCFVMAVHHIGKDAEKGGRGASNQLASIDTELSVEKTLEGFSCKDSKQRDLPQHEPLYFVKKDIEIEKQGKKFSVAYIDQGQPSDPFHTTGLNQIMEVVREHQRTGSGELFQKDVVAMTGMDQGQVSRGIKTLVLKGKLALTPKRGIFIPKNPPQGT